jgi:hypothetical protein
MNACAAKNKEELLAVLKADLDFTREGEYGRTLVTDGGVAQLRAVLPNVRVLR